jgi:hypothetical protein
MPYKLYGRWHNSEQPGTWVTVSNREQTGNMGDSAQLGSNHVVAFVHASEHDMAEVKRPDAVADFLEANRVSLQRIGEKEQSLLQADRAGVGYALDQEVAGILDRRQCAGIWAKMLDTTAGDPRRSRRLPTVRLA